jgi:hypothetical protein
MLKTIIGAELLEKPITPLAEKPSIPEIVKTTRLFLNPIYDIHILKLFIF